MAKRTLSLLLTGVLVTSVLSLVPAGAQEAGEPITIPDEVAIDDPFGDANYLNDQGNGGTSAQGVEIVPRFGDVAGPQDASTVADLGKIWFTHDQQSISVHIQTEVPLGNAAPTYVYDVFASPGEGSVASNSFWCLRFAALIPGQAQGQQTTWHGETLAKVTDRCNVGASFWTDTADGELTVGEVGDGTGYLTMTFPRDYSPLLEEGQTITTPYARSANVFGEQENVGFLSAPQVDNTAFGVDYELVAVKGGPTAGKNPKPKKKKNCNKIKNKKKKKACKKKQKKNKPPAAKGCAAYQPGELGAEAETTVVTDAATEEEPIEIEVPIGPALGSTPSSLPGVGSIPSLDLTDRVAHNVQVDTKSAEAGLYIRLETPEVDDPDLYVYWNNGTEAASVGGFNQTPVGPFDGTGNGGHSEVGAEQIDGLRTADCVGYDLDLVNWLGVGGTYTLKLWLGEIENDPAPRDG